MATDLNESTTSIGDDVRELTGENDELEVKSPKEPEELENEPEEPEDSGEPEEETEEPEQEIEEKPPTNIETHPFNRPSLKSIEEKFPGFFKQFPAMRDMYFREGEYSRLFPTIDDAKEANENNTAFSSIRESVFQGDGSKFFSAIKEVSDKDLEKFSMTVLSTLNSVHPKAFWAAANPLVEDIAKNMFAKGKKEGNESLQNAARYLADYFFGDKGTDIAEGKSTSIIKIEEGKEEINKEREKFDNEKHTAFYSTVEKDIRSQLVNLIDSKDFKSGKSRLDPDDVFSKFIRTTIVDRIIEDLGVQLIADKDHMRYMESLWNKAKQNGRTDTDKSRLISAYLERAKSLVPSLRSKYVSEARGGNERVASKKKEQVESSTSRSDGGTQGKSSNGNTKSYNPKSINYSKTSDADILNDNITYK